MDDPIDFELEVDTLLAYLAFVHPRFEPLAPCDIPELESAEDFIARMKAKDAAKRSHIDRLAIASPRYSSRDPYRRTPRSGVRSCARDIEGRNH